MTAQLLFPGPARANQATARLIELDFDVQVLDGWIDEARTGGLDFGQHRQRTRRAQLLRPHDGDC
jgi:hypothetical protein